MGIEIERKFLVTGDAWRHHVGRSVRIAQGYLNDMASMRNGTQKTSVRVRIAGETAFLNIKSRELGHTRQEFEYQIPVADGRDLLALAVGGMIDKTRHDVRHAGFLWEIDEFHGENAGLIVAEIELPSADTDFDKPDWARREVTDDIRYYNLALANRPYSHWTPEERT